MMSADKLKEKDGIQGFKKLKLAKVQVKKSYTNLILEEMVDQVRNERKV